MKAVLHRAIARINRWLEMAVVIEDERATEELKITKAALKKQISKKPIEEEKQYSEDYGFNSDILCPVCNNYIGYYTEAMCKPEYMQYCNECGQRIDDDWSGEDE